MESVVLTLTLALTQVRVIGSLLTLTLALTQVWIIGSLGLRVLGFRVLGA